MKRMKSLLLLWGVFLPLAIVADLRDDTQHTIFVETPGTLYDIIEKENLQKVQNLKVTGFLNDSDFVSLRYMCTSYNEEKSDKRYGELRILDVREVNIDSVRLVTAFFNYADKLEEVYPPSTMELLPAFRYCTSLRKISIPRCCNNIAPSALEGTCSLKSIVVEDGNDFRFDGKGLYRGNDLFYYVKSEQGVVRIPEGTVSLTTKSFSDCQMSELILPSSLQEIYAAFSGCPNLEKLVVPDGVKHFCPIEFVQDTRACPKLKTIVLGKGVESFDMTFVSSILPSFTDLYVQWPEPIPAHLALAYHLNFTGDVVLHVPAGCVEAYKSAPGWKRFKQIVETPEGVATLTRDEVGSEIYTLDGRRGKKDHGVMIQNGRKIIR